MCDYYEILKPNPGGLSIVFACMLAIFAAVRP